jgi:hypothetical protein
MSIKPLLRLLYVEDEDDNYSASSFIGMMTWRLFFLDGGIKAEMMSLSSNNFLKSFLHFLMVRSSYDEGLGKNKF